MNRLKRNVKIILAAVAAIVIAAIGGYSALRPLQIETVTVAQTTATLTFTEQGAYQYAEQYEVYPLVAGEVLEVRVRKGQRVKAGDVLAVVSASDYQSQIEQLQSGIVGYQGQISNLWQQEQQQKDTLAASVEELRGKLATLEAERDQNRTVSDSLLTQIDLQQQIIMHYKNTMRHAREDLNEARDWGDELEITQTRNAYNEASAAVAQSEQMLEQLRAGEVPEDIYEEQKQALESQIEVISSQIEKSYSGGMQQYYNAQIAASNSTITQLEDKVGKAEIVAAVDGVVSGLPVKDKNLISQAEPVAVIGNDPVVEVYVPVREIDGVALGDTVDLVLDKRLGEEIVSGTVTDIDTEAVVKLSALGVEERKVRVRITPGQPGLQIGYNVDARFSVYTYKDALTVPKTALFTGDDGKDYVWTVRDGALARQAVEKGIETRDAYIVNSGIIDGEIVIRDADNADLAQGRKVS